MMTQRAPGVIPACITALFDGSFDGLPDDEKRAILADATVLIAERIRQHLHQTIKPRRN